MQRQFIKTIWYFFIAWHFKLLYYICTPAELHNCLMHCLQQITASMRGRVGVITLGIVIVLASTNSNEENVEKWTHMTEAHQVATSAGERETHDGYYQSSKNNDLIKKHNATSSDPSCSDKMGCFLLNWDPYSVNVFMEQGLKRHN